MNTHNHRETPTENHGTKSPITSWGLHLPKNQVSRRLSRSFTVKGKEVLGELEGPGCIRRIWVTGKNIGRELILRIYFDGQEVPHVEAPLSDFFGIMHNLSEIAGSEYREGHPDRASYRLNTPFLASKPHNGFTAYFPMPFADSARIEVENGSEESSQLYYLIDWHEYPGQELEEEMRFCARWRREAPARDYQDDFLILDADGPGRLVGFVHSIDMLYNRHIMRWSHAGSDNIYIDGEGPHPAFLRGIGGEDTFGTSYGGNTYIPQSALFSDMPYYVQKNEDNDDFQKMVGYRFFVNDAIIFDESLHMRFGARAHDIASTVYWYSARPVRPFFEMPSYEERLPGTRPRRRYDLPPAESGQWWISGPFPLSYAEEFTGESPFLPEFDPTEPLRGRIWRRDTAKRGFVEFNHTFRPAPSNKNSATLDAAALARCELVSPRAGKAVLTFGWDDRLVYWLNGGEAVDLGTRDYFGSCEVEVELEEGRNDLTVMLTNSTGLTRGAWNFSLRTVTEEGAVLHPEISCRRSVLAGGSILKVDFGAGESRAQEGFISFVPPYAQDAGAEDLGRSVDIISSPQEEILCTPFGPVKVTAAVSDNTSIGFREHEAITKGAYTDRSELLRSEVRANPAETGEPVELVLTIEDLPAGNYRLVTYHHCHSDEGDRAPIGVTVDGDSASTVSTAHQTAGLNPEEVGRIEYSLDLKGTEPLCVRFSSEMGVVLNGFELAVEGSGE